MNMNRISFAAAIVALTVALGSALAVDSNPPLLADRTGLDAAGLNCAPPPPACPPAPPVEVCAPPPPICATPVSAWCDVAVQVPVKMTVTEARVVPFTRTVYEEECYTVNQKRTQIVNEVRTRTARKKTPYAAVKEVDEHKFKVVASTGNAPRLARTVNKKPVVYTAYMTEEYEEQYIQPVKTEYYEPVVKTRKVAKKVEDHKTVNVPVTYTVMETKTVKKRLFR